MISLSAALARIKRQKIKEFAGDCFVHREELITKIPYLQQYKEQQFLFGVYSSEKKWTAVSVNFIYAAYDGEVVTLRLDTETGVIFEYFSNNDFSADVDLNDGRRIWLKSEELAQLVLNIMLMLEKVPIWTVLEERGH